MSFCDKQKSRRMSSIAWRNNFCDKLKSLKSKAQERQRMQRIEHETSIMASPFEQFEIQRIVPMRLGESIDLTITNSTVYMIYALVIYLVLYKMNIEKGLLVPGR